MPTMYYIEGERIELGSELGAGGAGIVYAGTGKYSDSALKIWKPFTSPHEEDLTIRRVKHAIGVPLSKKIFKPLAIITSDKAGKKPAGIRMGLYPSGYLPIDALADTDTWDTYKLTQQDVGKILVNLYDIHIELHGKDICVADGNPLNFYFHPLTFDVIAGDVDAYHFGKDLPSTAGHVEYLAPARFATLPDEVQPVRKDLMIKQDKDYLPEHDWWTFMINAIRSLMRVHPYREGNTGIANPIDRIVQDMHIFSNPPPVRTTFPLKSLPDEFLSYCLGVLQGKRAEKPKRSLFEMLADARTWHVCAKHDPPVTYWAGRSECPHCARDKSLPAITAAQIGVLIAYILKQIFASSVPRRLLYAQAIEQKVGQDSEHVLVILARDKQGHIIASFLGPKGVKDEVVLPEAFAPNQSYALNAKYILIVTGKNLNIYSHEGVLLGSSATEVYAQHAIMSASLVEPVWLIANMLTLGKDFLGQILPQSPLHLSHGNTWFAANPSSDIVVGFTHWMEGYEWFATSTTKFGRRNIPIQFEEGEALTDWHVVFAYGCFAVIRRSQGKNRPEQVSYSIVHDDMSLIAKGELPQETKIQNLALKKNGTLFVPTENGICQYSVGKTEVLAGTENVPLTAFLAVINDQLVVLDREASVFVIRKSTQ